MASDDATAAALRAGAILPASVQTPKGEPVDDVDARAYAHPGLAGYRVVRLGAEKLAPGDDLEMEFLGFEKPDALGRVGKQRRSALGFPAWALINDPKNARYALEVVKEFKKHARRAKSKPGFAKEGIDGIGKKLGRSVAHFLPSFYEEAGRAFIETGNLKYAGQCFEKGREAERVHALDIDETVRRESFLEFALAGAVANKSLTNYAKELQKSRSPDEAYAHFRELCVKRTLGGMPPWSGMAKELRKLAKNAKKDAKQEDRQLLEDTIDSPSLAKAAPDFWKSYEKAVVALAADSPKVRGLLLNMFPTPSPYRKDFDGWWLEMLEKCGALKALHEDVDTEAAPVGSRAAWMSRLSTHVVRSWRGSETPAKVFELVRSTAKRLIADGTPVAFKNRYRSIDVNLTDLALELGVPVADPEDHERFDLRRWAAGARSPEQGRDPVHVDADERFSSKLDVALDAAIGNEPFDSVALGKKGLEGAKRRWLERWIETASSGGLPGLEEAIARLSKATSASTFAEVPSAYEKLKTVDVAPALARTLAGGIYDELGWDALDEALSELSVRPDRLHGNFPYVVATDGIKAIAVGPKGRLLEHDLAIPKGGTLQSIRYVGGQLVVSFRDAKRQGKLYWSSKPSETHDTEIGYYHDRNLGWGVDLPDGGHTEGGRAMRPGDTQIATGGKAISDGETFWRGEWSQGGWRYREYDPATGDAGRLSMPAFLEGFAREGMNVLHQNSWVMPAPDGLADSPFGLKDGRLGWRVRQRDAKAGIEGLPAREFESIDGRRFESQQLGREVPSALLRFPGDDTPRPISWSWRYRQGNTAVIWDPEGKQRLSHIQAGQAYAARGPILHAELWHLRSWRDEEGSTALRKMTAETARALIDAAQKDRESVDGEPKHDELKQARAALAKTTAAVTHDGLRDGVVELARHAAVVQEGLNGLVSARDPEGASRAMNVEALTDQEVNGALANVMGRNYPRGSISEALPVIAAFFAREDREDGTSIEVPASALHWDILLRDVATVMVFAAAPFTPDAQRTAVKKLLRLFVASGLLDRTKHLRAFRTHIEPSARKALPGFPADGELKGTICFTRNGRDYFVRDASTYRDKGWLLVVEHAPTGEFELLPKAKLDYELPLDNASTSESVESFLALLEEKGPAAWDEGIPNRIAERTGLSEPEAALIWTGFLNITTYDKNFLPKDVRTTLGLKVAEAHTAKQSLRAVDPDVRRHVLGAALPPDPTKYWSPLGDGSDDDEAPVNRLAQAWVGAMGKRTPIPQDLLQLATKGVQSNLKATAALAMFAEPQNPQLDNDAKWKMGDRGSQLDGEFEQGTFFTGAVLSTMLRYIPFLFSELPVGDPIRANIPSVLERVRQRLKNEDYMVSLGNASFYDSNDEAARDKARKAFLDSLGGDDIGNAETGVEGRDTGLIVASGKGYWLGVQARVGRIRSDADRESVESLAKGLSAYRSEWHDVVRAGSEGYTALAARVGETPVPEGQWEANPLHSAPDAVKKVGARYDVSEDAAVLYLQTLTLANPTTKAVQKWNDWKPARYKKAATELTKRKLLIEAKRSRAGRKHFLPGGWEALASPHPPIETWKLPLYEAKRGEGKQVTLPLQRFVALEPIHVLFARAFKRIEDRDEPKYEEVGRAKS